MNPEEVLVEQTRENLVQPYAPRISLGLRWWSLKKLLLFWLVSIIANASLCATLWTLNQKLVAVWLTTMGLCVAGLLLTKKLVNR